MRSAPMQKSQAFEKMHVLFVLQQGTVQWRDQFRWIAGFQRLRGDIIDEQQLDPVEQLRG